DGGITEVTGYPAGVELAPRPSAAPIARNAAAPLRRHFLVSKSGPKLLSFFQNRRAWLRYRQRCGCVPPRLAPNRHQIDQNRIVRLGFGISHARVWPVAAPD